MKPALASVAALLVLGSGSAFAMGPALAQDAPSVADSLRATTRFYAVRDLPEGYRAVAIESGGGAFGGLGVFGLAMAGGAGSGKPGDAVFFSLLGATFVDPDEFAALLAGSRPRIRGYAIDLAGLTRAGTSAGETPTPVFTETWLEAGRIVQWSPRPDLTRALLLKTFGDAPVPKPDDIEAQSAKTRAVANAKQVAFGVVMYASDYDDRFPKAEATSQAQSALNPYLKDGSVWTSLNPNGGRLLYNTYLSGVNLASLQDPSGTLLLWDERAWPDGSRTVAYTDGRAATLSREEWDRIWASELARRKAARRKAA